MLNMVCSQMLFLGSHFVRHFVTLNDIFLMANIDFWIQQPWNRVKRYVGLNTNKMPLDSLNDDFFKNPTWLYTYYCMYASNKYTCKREQKNRSGSKCFCPLVFLLPNIFALSGFAIFRYFSAPDAGYSRNASKLYGVILGKI